MRGDVKPIGEEGAEFFRIVPGKRRAELAKPSAKPWGGWTGSVKAPG